MKKYLIIFLISMVPLIELRGSIPMAVLVYKLPIVPSCIISVVGNLLPVPFIFFFARKVLEWGQDKKLIGGFCRWCINKGVKGSDKLQKKGNAGLYIALLLFVGIPLPGTGAWTGTLAASFLNMDFKKSIIAVMAGVLLAGAIMLAGCLIFGVAFLDLFHSV
ncbi:MAG: small multi-drug export protein [Bacteroidales bacterium]|nr:small multi-drug export protein [Bacteroidales bacterium]